MSKKEYNDRWNKPLVNPPVYLTSEGKIVSEPETVDNLSHTSETKPVEVHKPVYTVQVDMFRNPLTFETFEKAQAYIADFKYKFGHGHKIEVMKA